MDITTTDIPKPDRGALTEAWHAYRMRWTRRRLLVRAFRKRHQLTAVQDRTGSIAPNDVLAFVTVRNEATRLPYFLEYYRKLGVAQFLFVDNDSDDGTTALLAAQSDVSLWTTTHSYKLSRFGMDWLTWLMFRHGHGHWCLTVDADELLVYPQIETTPLPALAKQLDTQGAAAMGAVMLDMYPQGPLSDRPYRAGQDPLEVLQWFDADNITTKYQPNLRNLLVRGGVRARMFFGDLPERVPTLSKLPLVKWNRRYVYVSSTHSALPRRLNLVRGRPAAHLPSGALLHTKFLPEVVSKSTDEKTRQEHFANSHLFDAYYDSLSDDPVLWCDSSKRYRDWRQLAELGLISRGFLG